MLRHVQIEGQFPQWRLQGGSELWPGSNKVHFAYMSSNQIQKVKSSRWSPVQA